MRRTKNEDEVLPALKIALLGEPGVGRTTCLLRFVGIGPGEESLPASASTVSAIAPPKRAETGQRMLTLGGGTRHLVRIVSPELGGVSAATAAIALRGCDGAVAVWSSRGGVAALTAAALALRNALQHMPPHAAHCAMLLCNLHSGDTLETLLSSAEAHRALALCRYHAVVCAVAPRGSMLGPAAFDAVLCTLLRLADVHSTAVSSDYVVEQFPPSLLSMCIALLRDHWDAVSVTPRDALLSLPADLRGFVFWPPPVLHHR